MKKNNLSEEQRLYKMLLSHAKITGLPLTQEMVEYHLTGEGGWASYEGVKPGWVKNLPSEKKIVFQCTTELKTLFIGTINNQGFFRFGFIWSDKHPHETKYIGLNLIPERLHHDFYVFVDELSHSLGDDVFEASITKDNMSELIITTTRKSNDPLSEEIQINQEIHLNKEDIHELILTQTGLRDFGFTEYSIEYEIWDESISYRVDASMKIVIDFLTS